MPSEQDYKRIALRAARAAGKIHMSWLNRTKASEKSNPIDLVTEADREAEAAVIRIVHRALPRHTILAEETGLDAKSATHRWIIDPLDGTTNFAHGYPQFCVSIAYEQKGIIKVAVIYDALKREMFVGVRGRGAWLNGRRIKVSAVSRFSASLLTTGFPYDRRERRRFYLHFWESFMTRVQGVRRTGSAALDLAYVACGRIEGFWEFGLLPWDVAAGSLLVEEAGGRVTNMDGSRLDLNGRQIVASNGLVHQGILDTLAAEWSEAQRRQAEIDTLLSKNA